MLLLVSEWLDNAIDIQKEKQTVLSSNNQVLSYVVLNCANASHVVIIIPSPSLTLD